MFYLSFTLQKTPNIKTAFKCNTFLQLLEKKTIQKSLVGLKTKITKDMYFNAKESTVKCL